MLTAEKGLDPYIRLLGAIVRQAMIDGLRFKDLEKAHNKHCRSVRVLGAFRVAKGARDFIVTERLDTFLKNAELEINPTYIRGRFLKMERESASFGKDVGFDLAQK